MNIYRKNTFLFLSIFTGLTAGLLLKLFAFDILHISGSSMEPSLHNKSMVAVNKLAFGLAKPFRADFFIQWNEPELNDVVTYLHNNKIVVKRCAGVGGDQLEFSQNSGYSVTINQKEIALNPVQYNLMKDYTCVPEGYIFALGDNQKDSIDSRDYGFVSIQNITGKVIGK